MKHTFSMALFALAAILFAHGCDQAPLSGPPELRLGRDECAECGMLISEDRCCAALLVETPPASGHRTHLLYDDLGCLLDAEIHRVGEFTVLERHVRDHPARMWLRAESAVFLKAPPDNVHTPMASGMVAFANPAQADSEAIRSSGTRTDFAGLLATRREWWAARRRESDRPRSETKE